MAVSLSVVIAKDGGGTLIAGGLQAQDKSGAGTGPFTLAHIMIDGVAGTNMAAVTAANAVKVDGSAVTQPVSLTSTTITGSVTVAQATAASLNATVVGTGTFAVQAAQSGTWNITNVSGTVSLPTGASTSALQPTNAAQGSTTSGQTGPLMQGAVTTAAPTYTTAQTSPLSLTTTGSLRVFIDPTSVNANGQALMAASAPVVIASNQSALAVTLTSTTITGTVAVTQATAASLNATVVGTGTFAVQTTGSVNVIPATTGGLTVLSTLIASGTNATPVKSSAGQLYKVEITNNSANIGYLKLYNTAGTPTAGSSTPVIRIMCPGSASGAGAFSTLADVGAAFATGIGFTFTGGIADADTTSVAASAFIVNLYYK